MRGTRVGPSDEVERPADQLEESSGLHSDFYNFWLGYAMERAQVAGERVCSQNLTLGIRVRHRAMRMGQHLVVLATLLCVLIGCSGCGGLASGPPPPDQPSGHPGNASVDSGPGSASGNGNPEQVLTKEDYENAVRKMGECLADSNVRLRNEGWDPASQQQMLLTYEAPGMPPAKLTEIVDTCYAAHLDQTESRYVIGREPLMAADLMNFVQACLAREGIAVNGNEKSSRDLLAVVPERNRRDLVDCATEGARVLYPNIIAIGFP